MVHVLNANAIDPSVFEWASLPEEEVYAGIFRQTISGDKQTMVRYRYAPSSVFPLHSHPQEQITLVISGEIVFTVAGQEMTLSAGQTAIIPSGVEHGARVIGTEWVETFNAMSPRRDVCPGPIEGGRP